MAVLPLASCAAAATLVLLILLRRRRAANAAAAMVYELKGDYYQMLGHAWDHEVKDFKVVYRPLYHCVAGCHRFEAHHLAVSHFSRWERFRRLDPDEVNSLPPAVLSRLLPGPFWFDPDWDYDALTTPVPTSRSGLGHRSHERGRLEDLIGDYRGFISAVDGRLRRAGCAARARDYMLDHICYRVESVREYQQTLAALVPAFGTILVTSMIGGRPISIIRLKHPIEHCGYTVACLEVRSWPRRQASARAAGKGCPLSAPPALPESRTPAAAAVPQAGSLLREGPRARRARGRCGRRRRERQCCAARMARAGDCR